MAGSVLSAFDILEKELLEQRERSARQSEEIEKLKKQLKGKDINGTDTNPEARSLVKRDHATERKDDEIKDLRKRLKESQDYQSLARLALAQRDKELAELKREHLQLTRAANIVSNMSYDMDKLTRTVLETAE